MTHILDGKEIHFSQDTTFRIQLGRYAKGAYKTHMTFTGNLTQAVLWYNSLNIGYGYKKRLVMDKTVLARHTSN